MAKPRMSVTKRQREQKKRDRQQMKNERRAQRATETPQLDADGLPMIEENEVYEGEVNEETPVIADRV